ncbi:MAG: universal stress protein [Burkholderiales bacterium]
MKILIPVDGSASALRAVDHAIQLAKSRVGTEIRLITVQAPVLSGHVKMFISEDQLNAYYRDEGYATLKSAREKLDQAGVAYHHHIGVGHAAETIAQYAKENHCDQIIMGTRGMGAIADLVMGSVATKVIHLSNLPVTLIK